MNQKWSGILLKGFVSFTIACFLFVSGCATPGPHHTAGQNLQAPASNPKLLAVYMPWFGDHSHMDVGYSSQDPAILRNQIHQARERGISGFIVDWNGPRQAYSDHNFAVLEQVASENHFHVSLLYNEAEDDDSQATDDAMSAFDEAYKNYIGPQSQYRDAYLTFDNRPLIFIFPKRGNTDWNRIRQHCAAWESPPLLIYKDEPPSEFADAIAGSYAWVQPGSQGWKPDGSNWGQEYLDYFYKDMKKHPGKIVVGAAWPGFDDSRARWGLNRHMQTRCGETLDDTMAFYRRYYDDPSAIPFLLIETWNDYEEGTAIERLTTANCNNQNVPSTPTESTSR